MKRGRNVSSCVYTVSPLLLLVHVESLCSYTRTVRVVVCRRLSVCPSVCKSRLYIPAVIIAPILSIIVSSLVPFIRHCCGRAKAQANKTMMTESSAEHEMDSLFLQSGILLQSGFLPRLLLQFVCKHLHAEADKDVVR